MTDVQRAKALRAAGRVVDGVTRLGSEPLSCDRCKAAGEQTFALVIGRTRSGKSDVRMCAKHFAKDGVGLGAGAGRVLLVAGPPAAVDVLSGTEPAGYAKVILEYALSVLTPHSMTFIASRGARRAIERDGRTVIVLPPSYRPEPGLASHLAFALKYDGVNLEVLTALFRRVDRDPFERELEAFIAARPTGQYARRLWFLYEALTGRRLPAEDLQTGNYVPLLDPSEYFTAPGKRSQRHRILDNLLGPLAFSPIVRRTERLREFQAKKLGAEAARIVAAFDEDAIKRAVSYLYTKETRSSFSIEGENPSSSKTERFVALLRSVPKLSTLTREELLRLQSNAVDPRFREGDYRKTQVYVAEQVDWARQKIHYIAPCPQDVPSMMEGLLACLGRLEGSDVDPVVQAAVVAFGFVFIHPFEDGNGRLHRLLIHYVLSRSGFTPKRLIFPVSAVMLQRRHEYDEALEAFSVPLMRLIDYEEGGADGDAGAITVNNDTAHLYRFFDATPMAEALYSWVERTVQEEFRRELEFVVGFREIRQAIESIVALPDRQANLFVKLCLQNDGRLAPSKRKRHFPRLTDKEVAALERAVRSRLDRFPRAMSRQGAGDMPNSTPAKTGRASRNPGLTRTGPTGTRTERR